MEKSTRSNKEALAGYYAHCNSEKERKKRIKELLQKGGVVAREDGTVSFDLELLYGGLEQSLRALMHTVAGEVVDKKISFDFLFFRTENGDVVGLWLRDYFLSSGKPVPWVRQASDGSWLGLKGSSIFTGNKALIVVDAAWTGDTLASLVSSVRSKGYTVKDALCIISSGEEAETRLLAEGVTLHAAVTTPWLSDYVSSGDRERFVKRPPVSIIPTAPPVTAETARPHDMAEIEDFSGCVD